MRYLFSMVFIVAATAPSIAQDMPLYKDILIEGEGWRPFFKECKSVGGLSAAPNGGLAVSDPKGKRILFVDENGKMLGAQTVAGSPRGLFWYGSAIICMPQEKSVVAIIAKGTPAPLTGLAAQDIVPCLKGNEGTVVFYVTVPSEGTVCSIQLKDREWNQKPHKVAENLKDPAGIVLWPDEGTLVVSEAHGQHLWTYRIEKDGSLAHKEGYYTLRRPSGDATLEVGGLTVDEKGRLYAATNVGVQVFDPTGRICGVLLKPKEAPITAVALGGPKGDTLFVACGDEVFARTIKPKGVPWKGK